MHVPLQLPLTSVPVLVRECQVLAKPTLDSFCLYFAMTFHNESGKHEQAGR